MAVENVTDVSYHVVRTINSSLLDVWYSPRRNDVLLGPGILSRGDFCTYALKMRHRIHSAPAVRVAGIKRVIVRYDEG